MIYEVLNKPRTILTRIRLEESEMEALRYSLYPSAVRYDTDKVQSSPKDPMPVYAARVDDIEERIKKLKLEYLKAIDEVKELIAPLNDIEREVLTFRYIRQWSWQTVALETNHTEDGVHKIRRRAVKKLEEINNLSSKF